MERSGYPRGKEQVGFPNAQPVTRYSTVSMSADNPYDYICSRCDQRAAIHGIRGQKMICHDGEKSTLEIWQVIEVKRALGHKIPPTMAYAAMKSREAHDAQSR